jgi:hypothetical protein
MLSATMFFPDLRVSPHPLLLHLHNILGLTHALLAKTAHAHRAWRALIEPTRASKVCRMHLMLWGSWRSASRHAEVLLMSVAFLLRSHVSRFTSASFGVALLVNATLFLHHAFLMHAALFVQALILAHATFLVYASLVVHAAPFMIPLVSLCLCLSLLLRLALRSKCLFLTYGILAT